VTTGPKWMCRLVLVPKLPRINKRELGVRTEVACELANNEYESKFTPKLFNKLIWSTSASEVSSLVETEPRLPIFENELRLLKNVSL
jgi:hypothetical protein